MNELVIGVDIGTSGVRAVALNETGMPVREEQIALPAPQRDGAHITQDPQLWWDAVWRALQALCANIDTATVRALAVDGTSGTLLVCDADGAPHSTGWMYNDASCTAEAARIATLAPANSPAQGASSPLARLLRLQAMHPGATHALHQADWISGLLTGKLGISDSNNALKLGYDVAQQRWPDWLDALGVRREWLPQVLDPGSPLAPMLPRWTQALGLPSDVLVCTGTTDGVAAFLASGASQVGDAVTSLGSTLVVKLLSDQPVTSPAHGIYSHRLGSLWLPGGASNSGGAALLTQLSAERMAELTPRLQPDTPTGLDYYPLPTAGERFPYCDPARTARVTPRPDDDLRFFQGLLEGIAAIEQQAYRRLTELGAPPPRRILTVGGGARNEAWRRIRERLLGIPVETVAHDQAACGAARLAREGLLRWRASSRCQT